MEDLDKTQLGRSYPSVNSAPEITILGSKERIATGRFEVGDLIMNRYQVLAELGQGGMGVVYKCFDNTAGVAVALKALPPDLSHNTLEMEDIQENFRLVANLVHQNIAISKNLEYDQFNGNYYLIMECVEGEDLRRWLKRKRREGGLTLENVLPVIRQVAAALDYAHEKKVIHRDIKPGNIMIEASGQVKVLDFGLAAQIHTSMTRVSMAYHGTSGTGPYMAPEQWKGRAQGAPADQYALAVMTYEMLAGHLPFESPDATVLREAVLNETPDDIAELPKTLNLVLQKAMSKDAGGRFESCAEFVEALSGKKFKPVKNKNTRNAAPAAKRNGKNWIWVLLAIVLLCGIGGGYGYWEYTKRLAAEKKAEEERQRSEYLAECKHRVYLMRPELLARIQTIQRANLDRRQKFGEHIDEAVNYFNAAESALKDGNSDYDSAVKFLEIVKNNCEWIEKNRDLRDNVARKIAEIAKYDEEARSCDLKSVVPELYTDSTNALASAQMKFDEAVFDEAMNHLREAEIFFKNALIDGKQKIIQNFCTKIETAQNVRAWDEVQKLAEMLKQYDPQKAESYRNFALEQSRLDKIKLLTQQAEQLQRQENWQALLKKAAELRALDTVTADIYTKIANEQLRKQQIAAQLKKVQDAIASAQWDTADDLLRKILQDSPQHPEALKLARQVSENLVHNDEQLKRYLLKKCEANFTDYLQKYAKEAILKFDFKDFSKYVENRSLLADVIDLEVGLSVIRYLVEQKKVDINQFFGYGKDTALYHAVSKNRVDVVQYLLDRGANANANHEFDGGVRYSIINATKELAIVKLLVEHGADIHLCTKEGKTTADNASFEIAQYLMGKGVSLTDANDLYRKAAAANQIAFLKQNEARVRQIENIMLWGAQTHNLEMIQYLESLGASFEVRDEEQNTVLHKLMGKEVTVDCVRYVLGKGLDVNAKNKDGRIALGWATENLEVTRMLLEAGADVYGMGTLSDDAQNNQALMALLKKYAVRDGALAVSDVAGLKTALALAEIGDKIHVKAGHYILGWFTIKKAVKLVGDGQDKTILETQGSDNLFVWESTQGNTVYFENMTIKGEHSALEMRDGTRAVARNVSFIAPQKYYAVQMGSNCNLRMSGCKIRGKLDIYKNSYFEAEKMEIESPNNHGIYVSNASGLILKDCTVTGNDKYGALYISSCEQVALFNCRASNNHSQGHGLDCHDCNVYAEDCTFKGAEAGIGCGGTSCLLNTCRFEGAYGVEYGRHGTFYQPSSSGILCEADEKLPIVYSKIARPQKVKDMIRRFNEWAANKIQ